MNPLPISDRTLLVRTDFSDDAAWDAVCADIRELPAETKEMSKMWAEVNALMGQAVGGLQADLELVDDRQYAGLTVEKLVELVPAASGAAVIFAADEQTIANPEHPILVVDVAGAPGRHFRASPSQIQSIENNLSIANMDWEDFAQSLDDDGVFRGFSE